MAIFIITPQTWQSHNVAGCRVDFWLRGLRTLQQGLAKLNIPLLIRSVPTFLQVPELLEEVTRTHNIQAIFFNKQYELDELRRDQKVCQYCRKQQLQVYGYDDQVIVPPGKLLTQQNTYYQVFAPFKRAWLTWVQQYPATLEALPAPQCQRALNIEADVIPSQIDSFVSHIAPEHWPAGEHVAQQKLDYFIEQKITSYYQQRDFPALEATSGLSPYLAAGMISPRQCIQAAQSANNDQLVSGKSGATAWINEFIWRDFYKHIVYGFPRVCRYQPFKENTEALIWDNNSALFQAWCEGQTGYPIVDAAMRQINQMGWMHNRLRMIVAMFLAKDLWLDWRWGDRYFMQHLVDGDFAANNGGWQWAASTGTDAVPYFRVFNPVTQSERFDPSGDFIRYYCPELAHLDNKIIHFPYCKSKIQLDYPNPIIEHNKARQRAIQAFQQLKQ